MVATLIVPGLNGSDEGHWQRHWIDDHASASLVEQTSWSQPDLQAWLGGLEAALERAGEAWIVAHSLGCILTANLAQRPSGGRIRGALLVAPCDLDRTERLHPGAIDFGTMPDKALPFPTLVVGSRNDPYMSFDGLRGIASRWRSDVVDLGLAGHVNIASGFGRWEGGYDLFSALGRRAGAQDAAAGRRPVRHTETLFGSLH